MCPRAAQPVSQRSCLLRIIQVHWKRRLCCSVFFFTPTLSSQCDDDARCILASFFIHKYRRHRHRVHHQLAAHVPCNTARAHISPPPHIRWIWCIQKLYLYNAFVRRKHCFLLHFFSSCKATAHIHIFRAHASSSSSSSSWSLVTSFTSSVCLHTYIYKKM